MEKTELYKGIHEFLERFGLSIGTAFVGLVAKVSNEILMRRKLSWIAWCAIIGVSLFWAWMAGLFCSWRDYDPSTTSMVIGITTLLGEKINIYLSQNYKRIFEKIISIFTKK